MTLVQSLVKRDDLAPGRLFPPQSVSLGALSSVIKTAGCFPKENACQRPKKKKTRRLHVSILDPLKAAALGGIQALVEALGVLAMR